MEGKALHSARKTAGKKNGGQALQKDGRQGCKSLLLTSSGANPSFCPNPLPADRWQLLKNRPKRHFSARALFEKENKGSHGAGHLVSPTKVKALAVSITKRNLDFLRVEDFGK